MPGEIDKIKLAIKRPCVACYLTSFKANLTYPNGSTANINTGAMIHHVVLANQFHFRRHLQRDVAGAGR
jgi:hypothetical protein